MTSKKWQELAQQQTQELTARIETLANDVNHVLDMPNLDLHEERGHRTYMIAILEKESLLRKYAKWLEKNGGHASIGVLTYHDRRRVVYRYSATSHYTPLPPSTRFDRECKCWHCGKPVSAWWRCRERGCNAYTCDTCSHLTNSSRCPLHTGMSDHKTPDYKPTAPHRFTVGLEIETERRLSDTTRKAMCTSPFIAGWAHDVSLPDHALEYQTQPLTPPDMPGIAALVRRLPECKLGQAGGHMHVSQLLSPIPPLSRSVLPFGTKPFAHRGSALLKQPRNQGTSSPPFTQGHRFPTARTAPEKGAQEAIKQQAT